MIEFFAVLGLFVFFLIVVFLKVIQKIHEQLSSNNVEPPIFESIEIIDKSTEDLVGKYQDKEICRFVKTKDGRTYTFESLAIEAMPGTYYGDCSNAKYILVDKCLLYREVLTS